MSVICEDGVMARRATGPLRQPTAHPSGATPPNLPAELVPNHVAIVMDGNGRWANERGLPRTKGHEMGEASLLDCVHGAIELGISHISAYAFSTENWKRSPEEVKFLMGFNRDVIRRRRDEMNELGVRVRWAGRRKRLWKSVIDELETAEEMTKTNSTLTLTMCVNYGGRAEIADAAHKIADDVRAKRLDPDKITERTIAKYLDEARAAIETFKSNEESDIGVGEGTLEVVGWASSPLGKLDSLIGRHGEAAVRERRRVCL